MALYRNHRHFDDKRTSSLIEQAKSGKYKILVWGTKGVMPDIMNDFLKRNNISIDFFSDNYANNKNILGDKYISLTDLQEDKNSIICFVAVNSFAAFSVSEQLLAAGIYNIVTCNDILHIDENLDFYLPVLGSPKTVFYTCITGSYDKLIEPKFVVPGCDYTLISDNPPPEGSVFKWTNIVDVVPKEITDNHYKNRFCKFNPHLIFPDYRYSIYFDGNIDLRTDITDFIKNLGRTRLGVTDRNPVDCAYMELFKMMRSGLVSEEKALSIYKKYSNEGFPRHFGSFECSILLREHNNPVCKSLDEQWWEETKNTTGRDQIAFPYVLWKNGFTEADVLPMFNGRYCVGDCHVTDYRMDVEYWYGMKKFRHEEKKRKF